MLSIGKRYNIRMLASMREWYDRDGCQHATMNVLVYDTKTDRIYQYRGRGEQIGNFFPVWIKTMKGSMQLTQIETATEDLFPARSHKLVQPGIIITTMVERPK